MVAECYRRALGTQDLWLEGHPKPTERMWKVFSNARCPTLLHLHDSLFFSPLTVGFFGPQSPSGQSHSCAKQDLKTEPSPAASCILWEKIPRRFQPNGLCNLESSSIREKNPPETLWVRAERGGIWRRPTFESWIAFASLPIGRIPMDETTETYWNAWLSVDITAIHLRSHWSGWVPPSIHPTERSPQLNTLSPVNQ